MICSENKKSIYPLTTIDEAHNIFYIETGNQPNDRVSIINSEYELAEYINVLQSFDYTNQSLLDEMSSLDINFETHRLLNFYYSSAASSYHYEINSIRNKNDDTIIVSIENLNQSRHVVHTVGNYFFGYVIDKKFSNMQIGIDSKVFVIDLTDINLSSTVKLK
mgnify:FL=1